MELDHIAIWTNDLEKVKYFYLKYFTCKASKKYENAGKQFSSYFLTFPNGIRIELMHRMDITRRENRDGIGLTHLAINMGTAEKVDSLTARLKKDGYSIEGRPRVTGDGYYESVVLDPENNRIELTAIKDFTISPAEESDLERILFLQKCCYLSEAEIYNNYTIPPLTQTIQDIQYDFNHQTLLKLEIRGKIVGSVRAYVKLDTCYVGKLIVDQEYRNMGFGKLLMETIEKQFSSVGRFELFTGHRSEKNLYLYSKLGYIEFKEELADGMILKFLEKRINRQ